MNFENINAKTILKKVEEYLETLTLELNEFKRKRNYYYSYSRPSLSIRKTYTELSIFDWWKDNLSITDLKNMKHFLETAIAMGYDGYVCFKVGAKYCANGMWAHKDLSTDGYSPDGDFIYRSFTPEYVAWDAEIDGELLSDKFNKSITQNNGFTLRELKKRLGAC